MFAAGVGQYNVNTAQARAINTQTTMQFNEYLWESQQLRNQRYYREQSAKRKRINESADAVYKRLKDNPETANIYSGDALNIALDQVTSPKVYVEGMKQAQVAIPSALIRQIPFNNASEALTIKPRGPDQSRQLAGGDHPESGLREGADRAFRLAAAEARKEDDEGELEPATLKKLQGAVAALRAKVEATYPRAAPSTTRSIRT